MLKREIKTTFKKRAIERHDVIQIALKKNYFATCTLTLRAIGQTLDMLHVEAFDLERKGENYLLQGKTRTPPLEMNDALKNHHQILGQGSQGRYAARLSSVVIELHYRPQDISRLEREGQAKRRDAQGMPDKYSLSQILRAVGHYIDLKRARFLKLSKRGQWITIRYKTAEGCSSTERLTISSLYPVFVRMYLKRNYRSHKSGSSL